MRLKISRPNYWMVGSQRNDAKRDAARADFQSLEAADSARSPVFAADETFAELEIWQQRQENAFSRIVRKQPFKACLISAGAGAIVGAVILRW